MATFGSKWRHRLVSPVGFALVLVCFSFPFVTVSCETESASMTADYTGWDFVIGGKPHITTGPPDGAQPDPPALPPDQPSPDENAEPVAIQAFALLTVLVVAAGVGLVVRPRVTPLTHAVVASVAIVLLVANQAVAQDHLIAKLRESDVPADVADGLVDTRYGFSLALTLLLMVAAYNVVEMRLERRPGSGAGSGTGSGTWPFAGGGPIAGGGTRLPTPGETARPGGRGADREVGRVSDAGTGEVGRVSEGGTGDVGRGTDRGAGEPPGAPGDTSPLPPTEWSRPPPD